MSVLRRRLGAFFAEPAISSVPAVFKQAKGWLNPQKGEPTSLNRQIIALAWPSLVENLLQTMLGAVDLMFVGQLGDVAIAGVGLGNQLMNLLVVLFFGLSVGNQALVARAIGANDRKDAQRTAKQSLIIAALLSIIIAVLGFPIGQFVIGLMGAAPDVTQLGTSFMGITSVFALSLGIMVIGGGTLRGAGDTRTPMLVTGFINVVNILLDYGLIFGNLGMPKLGAIGSAYATSIARSIGALLILYVLFKRGSVVKLDWRRGWRIRTSSIARILNIGWPSAMEQIIFQFGFLVFSSMVVSLGTADLAAMQVSFNIANWSNLPAFAFGVAALTLVGQSLGAGDVPRAEATVRQSLKNAMVWMSVMGVAFIILRRQLFGMYTNDPDVINLGDLIMVFIALGQPIQSVAFVTASALRGAGDTRAPMVITAIGVWVVRVGVGYILGIILHLGLFGVWVGWICDFVMRATLLTLRFRTGRWKAIRV